jgi:hypothetical protein
MTLRVLGYREENGWAAHCLETDLVGRGRDFNEAMVELQELTEMQVNFAVQTNRLSLLDHPAPPEIWQAYTMLAQERLRNFQKPDPAATRDVGALPLPGRVARKERLAWCGA